jgi:hypothetical protein
MRDNQITTTSPELEPIQTHVAQKSLLWEEVGAHAVRKRPKCVGVVWAGAGLGVGVVCCLWSVLSLKPLGLSGAVSFLCVVL